MTAEDCSAVNAHVIHVHIKGYTQGPQADDRLLDRLFSQPEFVIRHGSVVWTDEMRGAPTLQMDEVDLVLPWRALAAGQVRESHALVAAVRRATPGRTLKLILESGELAQPDLIGAAARLGLDGEEGDVTAVVVQEAMRVAAAAGREAAEAAQARHAEASARARRPTVA